MARDLEVLQLLPIQAADEARHVAFGLSHWNKDRDHGGEAVVP
jgi:hypothetical protein